MTSFYVYLLTRQNGTPFYVGMGSGSRIDRHEILARSGDISHRSNVIRKIWANGGTVGREIVARFATSVEAKKHEVCLIQKIGRLDLKRGPLVNQTKGGDGVTDWSDELRRRHSLATKIAMNDPEMVERCRQHMANCRSNSDWAAARANELRAYWADEKNRLAQSMRVTAFMANPENKERILKNQRTALARPEVREKMRAAKLGKKLTKEHAANIANANTGRRKLPRSQWPALVTRFNNGERRVALAQAFGVDRSTLYKIVRESIP